jgi:hypothetical protein
MRFMMLVKGNDDYEAGRPPSPKLMAAIGELARRAQLEGKMVMSEGLKPSSASTKIRLDKGRKIVTDGPFAETKEVIGGFAIFELASRAEALEMANRFAQAHLDAGVLDFEMEIRPLFGPEDFSCSMEKQAADSTVS